MIFPKHRTHWFALLKILKDFSVSAIYISQAFYVAHIKKTYLPSISCALHIDLILGMPVHWIVARVQGESVYRVLNNNQELLNTYHLTRCQGLR